MKASLVSKLRFGPSPPLSIDKRGGSGIRKICAVFATVQPTPIENPTLVVVSQPTLDLLEISAESEDFVKIFSGAKIVKDSEPLAHCYCGFQFGVFAGQLGDGAALSLGRTELGWEVGLKGSGLTPFSRRGDGRKVLRSSIREFLGSEAMHALGVPTTRAASLIVGSSAVWRDVKYDGHAKLEKCAVISRVARTFFRFGSFEIARCPDPYSGQSGPAFDSPEIVMELMAYVRKVFFDDCTIEDFVQEVTRRTASLVAKWQTVGFCHGVLNTDNMSIIGDTIDYGPYAFMEQYKPDLVANTTDRTG